MAELPELGEPFDGITRRRFQRDCFQTTNLGAGVIKMGCCAARVALPPDAPEEEKTITLREAELGFSNHPAAKFMAVLLENSEGGRVTVNQFNTIATTLGLNTTDYDSPDTPMGKFYGRLKEKGKFDAVKLGVVGVLLARGEGKARHLFEIVAEKDKSPIDAAKVKSLFEAMAFVCGEVLPMLAKPSEDGSTPASGPVLTLAAATEYMNKLKSGKDTFVERCSNALMRGRGKVTQDDFASTYDGDDNLKVMTTAFQVRLALKKDAPAVTAGGPTKALAMFGKGLLGAKK